MKVTIGFTRTDRANDYVPMMDGYREGAAQDVLVLEVDAVSSQPEGGWQAVEVGEAFFKATNAPQDVIYGDALSTAIYEELVRRSESNDLADHRLSLSVGDTVQVDDGAPLVVASFGFVAVGQPVRGY